MTDRGGRAEWDAWHAPQGKPAAAAMREHAELIESLKQRCANAMRRSAPTWVTPACRSKAPGSDSVSAGVARGPR